MFKPTHVLHFGDNTKSAKQFPKGIPVIKGETRSLGVGDELEETVWYADSEMNVGGYTSSWSKNYTTQI